MSDSPEEPIGFLLTLGMLSVSLAVSLAIFVPLTGALVRFRSNYNPKSLQLDPEHGPNFAGPVVSSYFAMLGRVQRIEGWSGQYKGLMPTLLSSIVMVLFITIFLGTPNATHGQYNAPKTGIFGALVYGLFAMLVSLPASVITYRAITTPHKLSYLGLQQALRVLLTPTECQRPWIIYQTPGLFAAKVLHIIYVVIGLRGLRRLTLSGLDKGIVPDFSSVSQLWLGIYFFVALLSTAILCPLEVIATRLSIQRNHASAEFNSVAQEQVGDTEDLPEYSGEDEDVMGLRSEGDPYIGLLDTTKRMIEEEGLSALYRGWWLTMLASLAGAFS